MGVLSESDPTATAAPETARPEPVLAAAPFLVEFDEIERRDPARLDPARAIAASEEAPPPSRRAALPLGLLASLAVHLLPLLVLLHWNSAPAESAAPIPVQLVLEEPPPPPPPEASKRPPPGRLASVDIGDPAAKPDQPEAAAGRAADLPGDQPDKTQIAAALPPPKPMPPPELVSALPKPAPPPETAALPGAPQPIGPVKPPVKQAVVARLAPHPHPAPRAQVLGPAATRDEYLAYCITLVRRYYDMLPRSFLAGRHGATRLNILVLSDGTIVRVAVAQSSGYPEIDRRVEQMVGAVRRFPPLPQWVQGPSITLIYHLAFPDGLLEH